ncbi:4Fe-4S dicluster domain-containing protein [Natranaerovirga pectinivora]|nr:ferredoxin family protein [Natranaerovirga pectinivora]
MSISINKDKCVSCGRCFSVCPGNLISGDRDGKADIKCPRDCWGCTGCIKECPTGAIEFYLGLDIGGNGGHLEVCDYKEFLQWKLVDRCGEVKVVRTYKEDANRY